MPCRFRGFRRLAARGRCPSLVRGRALRPDAHAKCFPLREAPAHWGVNAVSPPSGSVSARCTSTAGEGFASGSEEENDVFWPWSRREAFHHGMSGHSRVPAQREENPLITAASARMLAKAPSAARVPTRARTLHLWRRL